MTLYVRPNYYDFFIRGMVPLQHYWPIRDDSKCTSLKFAVEWGNNNVDKVLLTLFHCVDYLSFSNYVVISNILHSLQFTY